MGLWVRGPLRRLPLLIASPISQPGMVRQLAIVGSELRIMPRKLTAAEHLQSYLADVAAGKESGGRRRVSYGAGLYLYINGPRSCRVTIIGTVAN
jgi:hypothetical protein